MNGRWRVAAVMGCMWVASLLYGEVFIYWLPVWTCPWPSLNVNQVQDSPKSPIRVLVIADPQITDRTSYGMKPGSLALWLTQFYSDIYMRRAFRTSVLGLEPEQIVFLGDLFDGGPFLSPKECVVVFCWSFCFCFEKKYPGLTCCFSVLIFFLLLTADGKSPWSALDIYLINHKEQSRTEVGKRFQCIHSLATMIWAMKLCKPKFLRLRIFSCHP
jgi:hypothetical protein